MEDPGRSDLVVEDPGPRPGGAPAGGRTRTDPTVPTGYSFRAVNLVWLATGVVDALIAIRFLLKLLGASLGSGFTQFMYNLTDPLVAPFRGIFPVTATNRAVIEPASIVAFIVYLLLGWGVVTLIRILTTPRGTRVTR